MVCPYDLSRPGGVQSQALGLARALRRKGHEVLVVAPDVRPPGWATGHVYVVGRSVGVRSNGSVAPVSVSPFAAKRAVDAVRTWGADVVHLHEPLAPVLGYGFLLARSWPLVATFHRSGVPHGATIAAPAARWACGRVHVRVAVSEVARRSASELTGRDHGDFDVLFNGVDTERFVRPRSAAAASPAVLFLGRHEQRKGLAVLLDAFSTLSSSPPSSTHSSSSSSSPSSSPSSARGGTPSAELWVAGDGPETAALRARYSASVRVHWLGVVSDEEAADRLAAAKVLCAPSLRGESFGVVLLEAMAARCRVVASDIAGYRDAAAGHATLVAPGDADALRAALEAALRDPPDDVALDAAASHAAALSMDQLAQCYVDAYVRAIRLHSGGAGTSARGGSVVAR